MLFRSKASSCWEIMAAPQYQSRKRYYRRLREQWSGYCSGYKRHASESTTKRYFPSSTCKDDFIPKSLHTSTYIASSNMTLGYHHAFSAFAAATSLGRVVSAQDPFTFCKDNDCGDCPVAVTSMGQVIPTV